MLLDAPSSGEMMRRRTLCERASRPDRLPSSNTGS
jgi:hypothetical protein